MYNIRNKINFSRLLVLVLAFLAVSGLSFLSFLWPPLNHYLVVIFFLAALAFASYDLEYGLLIVFAELFIGSLGHLFFWNISGFFFSVRTVLWLAIMLAFSVHLIWQLLRLGQASPYWQKIRRFPFINYFLFFFAYLALALLNGFWRGHSLVVIFSDFNAWLYFSLLFPAIVIYYQSSSVVRRRLVTIFLAAAVWISLETLALVFSFTHALGVAPEIYSWLRRMIIGEVTPTLTGWPRIFIQGQIYPAIAFLFLFFSNLDQTGKRERLVGVLAGGLFLSAVMVSFSRSFWVAMIIALLFSFFLIGKFFRRQLFSSLIWVVAVAAFSFALVYAVAVFPYPQPGAFKADFLSRLSSRNDAALASRWSLLPVLGGAVSQEPFLGQGFGATLSYYSRDPRVLENNPSGLYTTYAFEWGYLDLWLKLGALGLVLYLLVWFRVLKSAWPNKKKVANWFSLGAISAALFLLTTHIFTPYLNHPLGIGCLLLGSCLIFEDRVY